MVRVFTLADCRAELEQAAQPDNPLLEESLAGAWQYARAQDAHLEKLERKGLRLPGNLLDEAGVRKPETLAGVDMFPSAISGESSLTIFRKVPFIHGVPLDELEEAPPAELMVQRVISPLLGYYEYLNQTSQPYMLIDLLAAWGTVGYSGEQQTLLADGSDIVQHDLDAFVYPRDLRFAPMLFQDIYGVSERIEELEAELSDEEVTKLHERCIDVRMATTVSLNALL